MSWLKTFQYKWQALEIAFGLVSFVSGGILLLISVGAQSPLWQVLGGTFCCLGLMCTLVGVAWCVWSLRVGKTGMTTHALYGPGCDYEAETLTGAENVDFYRL